MIQPSPYYADLIEDLEQSIDFAKVREFEEQANRLGAYYVSAGLLPRSTAAEILMDAARATGLLQERSELCIRQIIFEGLRTPGISSGRRA
jgi:hypothetical protein